MSRYQIDKRIKKNPNDIDEMPIETGVAQHIAVLDLGFFKSQQRNPNDADR
jgi:hypothetical protein